MGTNKRLIGLQDLKAIEMKFKGVPLKKIAKETGIAYITVRQWFMTGGRLHEEYKEYCNKQEEILLSEAKKLFKKNIKNASIALIRLLKSNDQKIVIAAAKEIINRELGEPLKRVTHETDDTVMKILKEAGVIKEEKDDGGKV